MLRRTCALMFVITGALHFLVPRAYERIMPQWVPAHRAMVHASGVAETAGGLGLLTRWRRPAGWWLIATLIAIFPANVQMALHPDEYDPIPGGATALWARLPFQAVLIAWVRAASDR